MLDEQFKKQRFRTVRDLAEKADPFIEKRLLDLAARYESESLSIHTALTATNLQFASGSTGTEG